MKESIISEKIAKHLNFSPTPDQQNLLDELGRYILNSKSGEVLLVTGYAGTGKTSMISALAKMFSEVGIKSVMMAPTGRSAKVMSIYSGEKAYTIHKKIYRQKSALADDFVLDYNKDHHTFYIVDEASMITDSAYDSMFGSGNLLLDMIEHVSAGKSCRLIIVGDKAQLAPIGRYESPALEQWVLEEYCTKVTHCQLREVVRQREESAILRNATHLRTLIERGDTIFPTFFTESREFKSIQGIEFFEEVESAYALYGKEDTVVITRSNKQARLANEAIRSRILYMEEELSAGDQIMIVKNNYHYGKLTNQEEGSEGSMEFIANGDIAKIRRLRRYEEFYDKRFVTATLQFPDYDDLELECKVMLDTLSLDTPALTSQQSKEFFSKIEEDYMDVPLKRDRYNKIKEDNFYNALQIKFSYAITCHKAQGGQWSCVFIDRMIFGDEELTVDMLRWLYTAITRAKEKVILINFDERFF